MPIHPNFPLSPYEIIDPEYRWLPDGQRKLDHADAKLIAPLVFKLRRKVSEWRDLNYDGASDTSKSLLNYWFNTEHFKRNENGEFEEFKYYFAQREAVETVIYLHEIAKVRNKYDILAFSSNEELKERMFDESWVRFVIKMATGSGKTKVLSLILAWSYFHKLYEKKSTLARNFLVITPNIIVLDRIRHDFDGLRIFNYDPIIPDNGFNGQNWRYDFNLKLHIQDNVNIVNKTGNIFLTNIHRVDNRENKEPSFNDENRMDYFLGERAFKSTTDSKIDLGEIIRDIDELVILNDEAHHIHDKKLKWFKNIEDIHNHLLQRGKELSLQVDFTATPKTSQGSIFVQTIVDYPLVEAIHQNIVKGPVLPDKASLNKLRERESSKYSEKYQDYIHLGYREWEKVYYEHKKVGKKAILFVMTDDTKNCDNVANYLEETYPELKNQVLVIHTKNNEGDINENDKGKNKEELAKLRKAANTIDSSNKYKAIVSVLVLKEGWDVKNVTTIVGLRPFKSKSKILPEQTLGRGLRKMYGSDVVEKVSVIGTKKFIEFIEGIKKEGVEIEYQPMDHTSKSSVPLVIEVDYENSKKDIDYLDIAIPKLTSRTYMEFSNLDYLNVSKFENKRFKLESFSEKPIIIKFNYLISGEKSHETIFNESNPIDFRSVLGFFTETIIDSMRLVSVYDVLYGKLKEFITYNLFEEEVNLEDKKFLYNLSREEVKRTVIETFKKEINKLLVVDKGLADINGYINLKNTNPFMVKEQAKIVPNKSVFNRIIGDSNLELQFADFLDTCDDIISFGKNYFAVHFNLDYQKHDGSLSNYYPDFIVKRTENEYYVIETKGLVDLNVAPKIKRLKQWCEDVNNLLPEIKFDFVYVDEESFYKYKPKNFEELLRIFTEYKD